MADPVPMETTTAPTRPLEDKDAMEPPPAKKSKTEEGSEATVVSTDTTTPDKVDQKNGSSSNSKFQQKQFRGAVVETDVGITEYIGEFKGFNGVIKQRYSDFLVNEIDLQGQVIRLTDINDPQVQESDDVAEEPKTSVISEVHQQQLQKLIEDKDSNGKVEIKVGDDKQLRSDIHAAIREDYKGLDSRTENRDGHKYIVVVYRPDRTREERRRDPWQSGKGDYCHFHLYKENKDTGDAIALLAKMLRLRPGVFTFAGTKDKRGKTCQQVAVYRVPGSRLHKLNKGLRGLAVGDFKYSKEPLRLGDLTGNHFLIVLRNLSGEQTEIDGSLGSLRDKGFINYFGLQRFGTTSVPTHHVGRALLQGKWSDAVDLILKPREGGLDVWKLETYSGKEKDDMNEARTIWAETKDAGQALEKIRRPCIEKTLLIGLRSHSSKDFIGALSELPRNTRLMYVHAYQSYIWNVVASRRMKEYGFKVLEGDLTLKPSEGKQSSGEKQSEFVTSETLNDVSVHDLVLPLPGWDVQYPDNVIGEWYTELLKKDGLTQADLKNKVKDYSLPGDYRYLVIKPGTVEWRTANYEDPTQSLVLSDYEKLKGEELPATDGSYRALIMELSLPSSTYATMALREVLRTDTSACHQASLNQ